MKNEVMGNLSGGLRSHTWPAVALALLTIQATFAVAMRSSASLSVYTRIVDAGYFLLLVLATALAALNAVRSRQAIRLFWFFFALGCAAWALNAWSWVYYVGLSGRTSPDFLPASSSLVLHTAFMIAAVASRPHFVSPRHRPYQTTLDFLILLFFLLFLYAFLLFPHEYPQRLLSFTRFTAFYFLENLLLILILGGTLFRVRPPWKSIYVHMFGASVLYALGSLLTNISYMSGDFEVSLPAVLYTASTCWFISICLLGRERERELTKRVQVDPVNPRYAATLAMLAVVAIPIVGMWELFRTDQPHAIRVTRLLIVFLALLTLAITALVTEHFSKRELSSDTELANQRLNLAMGSGKSVGWEWDLPSGRNLWFGDLRTIFGIEADTFSGRSEDFYDYLHPDDRQAVSQGLSDARVNHKLYEAEFRIIRRDGALRWVTARGAFQYAKNGAPERMLGMAVDITDRRQAEAALRISEEKFSKAFRESPLAFTLTSAKDHRYLDVNETFERISGWRRDEAIGRTPFDLRIWVDPEERLQAVKRLRAEGRVSNVEFRFRCKDGSQRLGLMSAELIEISEEACIVAVIADITKSKQIEEKLQASEHRLRQVLDSAMDAIIAVDDEQKVVLFNAAAQTMFGCSAKDALGAPISRFIPERFRSQHAEHVRRFGESGETDRAMGRWNSTLWGIRANGEEFPIEASISRAMNGGKNLFTAIIRDTTERRRIEEDRRKSEERLHLAVQAGKMYAYEWDVATDMVTRSPECVDILGSNQPLTSSRREMMTRVHADDCELLQSLLAKMTPGNPTSSAHYRIVRPDGSLIWIEKRDRAFFDEHGRLSRTVGVVADVSDRKQAELALKESEERFRLVANTAPVMIWMAASDKRCTYFNQPWLQFTGRSEEAEQGSGWTENIHSEDRDACLESYSRAFHQRRAFNMQYRLRRHDGEYRWVLNNAVPRFGPDGSFGGFIGSCIDITDRKRAEEALATMGRRLLEAHEEERTWIARELHDDINQQLALVSVEMEQWNQHFPETAADFSALIQQARDRIFKISKDIQALSHRLHSSKLEYLGIATAARSFCRELSEQHNVQIKFSHSGVPRSLPPEVSLGLFRVLQEALQNAVKHSHARQFTADLRGAKDEIHLTVVDNGTGFDPTEAMNGRGLGLISMRERLQLVSGTLVIESLPGCGTTIRARVPFKSEDGRVSMAG